MIHGIYIFTSLIFFLGRPAEEKMRYHKDYYETGETKAEGWIKKGHKTGYWKFYLADGHVSAKGHYLNGKREHYWYFYGMNGIRNREGHYANGRKTGWWLYYDHRGALAYKCQLDHGIKNGYCLRYVNGKIASAMKYNKGRKIKEWYSWQSFKRENKLADLK